MADERLMFEGVEVINPDVSPLDEATERSLSEAFGERMIPVDVFYDGKKFSYNMPASRARDLFVLPLQLHNPPHS